MTHYSENNGIALKRVAGGYKSYPHCLYTSLPVFPETIESTAAFYMTQFRGNFLRFNDRDDVLVDCFHFDNNPI